VPELPEVETVRVRLEPLLVGRRFDRVEILDPRVTRPVEPREVAAELEGETVAAERPSTIRISESLSH
jgi:formamidopyrimidine-DNA glycosylase